MSLERYEVISSLDERSLINKITDFHDGLKFSQEDIKIYYGELIKKNINIIAPTHGSVITNRANNIVTAVINCKFKGKKESIWRRIFR